MRGRARRLTVIAGVLTVACIALATFTTAISARGSGDRVPPRAPAIVEAPAILAAPAAAEPASLAHDCSPVDTTPPPPPQSLPGHVETFTVGGHTVLADVPGAYAVLPATAFPVV
jgi:hypothetical protein